MILAISSTEDDHASAVLEQLDAMGVDARLLDIAAFPTELTLSVQYAATDGDDAVRAQLGDQSLDEVGAVWWRRPQPFELSPALERDVDRSFAYTECQSALDGLWRVLDASWINHPTRDEDAARKPYQLRVAQQVGFEIPETHITNDPDRARAFVADHGPTDTVYKAFSGTERAWRETRVFDEDETALLDAVQHAPVIFQEYVPADVDLRITVMGDHIFPAAIHSQETDYEVDYRMTIDSARVEAVNLPEAVRDHIHAYMDRLGLVYGAIDMRRTPDGRYVFLEINPSGQWLFIAQRTDQPMTETFARLLARFDGQQLDSEEANVEAERAAARRCSGPATVEARDKERTPADTQEGPQVVSDRSESRPSE